MDRLVRQVKKLKLLGNVAEEKTSSDHPPTEQSTTEGLCLISKNPNLILKSAAQGKVSQFRNLYEGDNSRIDYCDDKKGRYAAHYAAAGNQPKIIDYIAHQIGVFCLNVQDKRLQTPLHVAVESGSVEATEALLLNGADTSLENSDQYSPFHLSVVLGQVNILLKLAKFTDIINIHQTAQYGRGALHLAAIFEQAQAARVLLKEFGLKPTELCNNGFTAIHEASRRASAYTLREFIQWGKRTGFSTDQMMALLDAEGRMPIHLAVHSGHADAVRLCLNFGAKINSKQLDRSTPVHLACVQGNMEIITTMLESQPDERWSVLRLLDSASMTPIHYAAKFNHSELLGYLFKQEGDINIKGFGGHSPVTLAAMNQAWKSLSSLLELGAEGTDSNDEGKTMLHYVALKENRLNNLINLNSETVSACISALVNSKDNLGCTPLHCAAQKGHINNLSALISKGASVNNYNTFDQTPLHLAARYGHQAAVQMLVKSNEGVLIINATECRGKTALHVASEYGQYGVVEMLLKHGSLLTRDYDGYTPLHLAAIGGFTDTVTLLLKIHKHIIDIQDKTGKTALHLASLYCRSSTVQVLLSSSCQILEDKEGVTAIDLCIRHHHSEVARIMFNNTEFSDRILSDDQGVYKCKVLALIEHMPSVLVEIMDRQIRQMLPSQSGTSTQHGSSGGLSIFDTEGEYFKAIPEPANRSQSTPLLVVNMMVKHGRSRLLMHSLTQKYLELKWLSYGRFFHSVSLGLYILFVLMLTVQAVNLIHVLKSSSSGDGNVVGREHYSITLDGVSVDSRARPINDRVSTGNILTPQNKTYDKQVNIETTYVLHSLMIGVCTFSFLNIVKIVYHMWHQGGTVMKDLDNYMEMLLYGTALASGSPVGGIPISRALIMCAAIAVFLAWFNLLLQLRSFNTVGLYVVMFLEIQKTMLKVLATFSVLVVAFGCSFYICMSQGGHPEFSTVYLSMIRMLTMMLGELDFLTVYVYPWILDGNSPSFNNTGFGSMNSGAMSPISRRLPYAEASLAFLSVFMVMMPLLLMNLLVGLAVGDIEAVQKNAAMKRLAMLVDVHTGLERKLPQTILKRMTETRSPFSHQICCNVIRSPDSQSPMMGIMRRIKRLLPRVENKLDVMGGDNSVEFSHPAQSTSELSEHVKDNTRAIHIVLNYLQKLAQKLDLETDETDESEDTSE